jgi:hypothetical protein
VLGSLRMARRCCTSVWEWSTPVVVIDVSNGLFEGVFLAPNLSKSHWIDCWHQTSPVYHPTSNNHLNQRDLAFPGGTRLVPWATRPRHVVGTSASRWSRLLNPEVAVEPMWSSGTPDWEGVLRSSTSRLLPFLCNRFGAQPDWSGANHGLQIILSV